MATTASARSFVNMLARFPTMPGVFNPWRDVDDVVDIGPQAPKIRTANLIAYLEARRKSARLILVGEAPGYRGCHICGIPFTSERILLGYMRPGIEPEAIFRGRKTRATRMDTPLGANKGSPELSATIAWKALLEGQQDPWSFVFWNAFPFHPHRAETLHSNRRPSAGELLATRDVLDQARALFPKRAKVVAVGRVAERALGRLGVEAIAVRHPSQGGATKFRTQVAKLLREGTGPR